jgi:hypothetical protein
MTNSTEQWKAAKGFHGLLEVSNLGNFRTITRTVNGRVIEGGVKRPSHSNNGYLEVRMSIEGIHHRNYAHRIVWATFKGSIPVDKQVNHKDMDKSNNALDNLEIVTASENVKHAYANGRTHKTATKYTEEIVLKYIELRSKASYTEKGLITRECNEKLCKALNMTPKELGRIPFTELYKRLIK